MTNKENVDYKTDILDEPIAIVGANCQFPGMTSDIEDLDTFYEMLLKEQTPIKDVPKNRWNINQYYDADRQKADKIVSRKGGFLDDPGLFDAAFFKIPPIEAKQIDPQHRLFLEVSIRALNNANITIDSLKHSNTGVYCGLSTNDYSQLNLKDKIQFNAYTYLGSASSAAPGRLSYFLNLKGPCMTVDTACSSSLSALYLAAMALRTQQCDMAIVGGIHLNLCPEVFIGLSKANMLSAIGASMSFDAQADGYVRSEGCAVVILKRLSDAIRDKNKIHAIIKSIIMNQDGGGMGMAAPNVEAQIAMHHAVLDKAHLTAKDIDYIETHGTGTVLGDSVELQAIQNIHQGKHSKDNPLIIGALKSNLGHTISASGMASLVKVIGCFKQGMIPSNLHYSTPNDSCDLNSIPALLPIQARPFSKHQNKKRYVQISSFGFTGTNVSAIIEEPPNIVYDKPKKASHEVVCFVISANSQHSLQQMLKKHLHFLKTSTVCLSDLCSTLINCRDHYKYRCAIIAQDRESLIKKIESGDYSITKTIIKKEITFVADDAQQHYAYFLLGANIRLDLNKISFNPIDLPLYVFDRKAYWHDVRTTKEVSIAPDWCFNLEWQYQPINKNNYKETGQRWLLMGEQTGDFGLQQHGLTILRESDNDSFDELDGIIIAEGFGTSLGQDSDSRINRQKNTLKKIVALIKTLADKAIQLRLIFLIANNKDTTNLDSSPLKGFCKTLCLELPQYQTILVDLDRKDKTRFAEYILDEVRYNHGQAYEHVVAYDEGRRLISCLKRTALPGQENVILSDGRYLITGGCGGLGLITSQALLSAGASELVLVSRTIDEPSIKATIKKMQAHYPDRVIRLMSLDISDKENVHKLLLEINSDGLLKGIIHAAGVSINKPILHHNDDDIDHLFSAKVKGAWYLHELSLDVDLDFFVVYSSISAVLGSNKESVYSATNSFLDALISERTRLGLVGTAIQWGPWAEVGMAKKRSRDQGLKEALIDNEQGQAFIQRLLTSHLSHATIISPAYLQFMLDFVPEPKPAFYNSLAFDLNKEVAPPSSTNLSPWLSDYFKRDAEHQLIACKSLLSNICNDLLELGEAEALDEDGGFFDIGLDSLMMAELATGLKKNLKPLVQVVATIAFDYPSINQLAEYIHSELKHHLPQMQPLNESICSTDDSIAIIGISCNLPNAPDINAFEQLLENGLSGIKEIPLERWDNRLYYDPNPEALGKTYVNKLGLIDNIKLFDPQFFGISPREAAFLDPQQRLFLENCYHALEYANYPPQSLRGSSTGVYAGVNASQEYYTLIEKSGYIHEKPEMFSVTGKALNIIPGRVAYTFDFKGPAVSIDTACSSSLVAIHYACSSLKNREIDLALAGGVNILLRPDSLINLSRAKALSPDGQCKTFDEKADGYVRSEGCGVLLLKRTSDALRDKDTILAIIKGSAVNNDGKSAGLTVPNGKSQEEVMRKALSQAKLDSRDISYIEAHGTGTSLGDPIEVHAINAVYGKQRDNDNPLHIGTVKTNIGHLESAAGVTGLIKVVLGLQKKRIYKNLNFNRLNPKIKLDATQIALNSIDWIGKTTLKSAGVSAFGFSGTNAHIVLQEFAENKVSRKTLPPKTNALLLSAKSPIALDNLVKCYQTFLATSTDDFNNICYTAAMCRDHYPNRLVVVAKDASTASQLLKKGEFASSQENTHCLDWLDDAELMVLTRNYLQGKSVDWASYYKSHQTNLNKVILPSYSFARNEYWLETQENTAIKTERLDSFSGNVAPVSEEKLQLKQTDFVSSDTVSEHLYETKWIKLHSNPQNVTKIPDFWVISTNAIRAEKLFGSLGYQLIDTIDKLHEVEDKNIVFLYEENQFNDLFHCFQKLFKSVPANFILVTENAYALNDTVSSKVNPHHTMASTFWKSFKNELELNRNYAIDLDSKSSLVASFETIFNTTTGETEFAVRDAIYVPRLKKKKLPINSNQKKTLFDAEGCYLITGGTGGLAKPLMEYLIRNGVKRIIITSRSECSLEIKKVIESARIQEVDITHYAADASNLLQMEQVFKRIEQSAQVLKGVFHLAGVISNELIINLSEEELQKVVRAKMESALILHQLTQDTALDMFVLFSSASSILGSRRQSNYAAANGFLDGLAHLRHQQGLPALAINWGVFHKIGMAAEVIDSLRKRGFIPLDAQSFNILDSLLQSHLPQIVICPMQWGLYFKNTPKHLKFSEQNETGTSLSGQPFLSFLRQHTQKEQSEILNQVLCDIAADVLGLDSIEPHSKNDLFAMGMDSLMSLELRSRIHDKLQCPNLNLPIEYFINDPRIDKVTKKIAKELAGIFSQAQDYALPKDARVGAIALSDTQYGFWLADKMGYSFNCPKQIQLHGKLNREYLTKAFAFTINRNGAFWLNFHKDIPIQMLKRQGQFNLIYEDISADYDQDILNKIFYRNTMRNIPLNVQPLIRVYLYKLKEDLHELHIIIPHIILDETSFRLLFKQFKDNYETLLLGKSLIPVQEQYGYLDYVKQSNHHYEKNLQDKIDFWQVYNNGFQKLSFGRRHHLPDAARQTKNLFNYIMEKPFVEKFKEWHKERNINVSTGLIAASQIVFYKLSSQKKIPIMVLHNERENSRYDSVVGLFLDYKRVNITLNENDKFLEFFKSIENEFIKAAPFQKCTQFIKSAGLKESLFSIGRNAMTLYHKLFLSKNFKVSDLNSVIRAHYLKSLSDAKWDSANVVIKDRLNRLFRTNLRLLKPKKLTVVFNITSSFFIKEPYDTNFSSLNMTIPNHYGSVDRHIGNQTLWIYFTKDQFNDYRLSINGPLTSDCKDLIAQELKHVMTKIMENDEYRIAELT